MAQFSINSNDEPHFICKTHGNPMYLNYTLGSTLSRAGISTLLFHARQKVLTRIDQDLRNGRSRIRETLPGRFWQYRADLLIYANDLNSRSRDLTWNELLQAIDLVRYCGVDKGIYLETVAEIFLRDVKVEIVNVKLHRAPDESDLSAPQ